MHGRLEHSISLRPPFVRNRGSMWDLYRQAKAFGEKPSALFGIKDNRWLAWQFDQAVLMFGTWVDNKLNERDDNGKPKHKLDSLLGQAKKRKLNRAALMNLKGVY